MQRDYIGKPWTGVDLDGTLAYYDGWKGIEHIGRPIWPMVERVKRWLKDGKYVKIFTARVSNGDGVEATRYIEAWCLEYIGQVLPVTNVKDYSMVDLWDDRAVQVVFNEGEPIRDCYIPMKPIAAFNHLQDCMSTKKFVEELRKIRIPVEVNNVFPGAGLRSRINPVDEAIDDTDYSLIKGMIAEAFKEAQDNPESELAKSIEKCAKILYEGDAGDCLNDL